MEIPEGLWQEISINIIRLLPQSKGKDAIVVIVDLFTKMIWLKKITITILSQEIAKIYQDKIWKLHGVPRKVLSDKRPQFASKFMEELFKALKTKQALLTAYHSQTNRQTEGMNQEIKVFLWHYMNY